MDGCPKLEKVTTESIVKVLLPRVAPDKIWSGHKGMKKGKEWLHSLAGGTTWDLEMEALIKDHTASAIASTGRLF